MWATESRPLLRPQNLTFHPISETFVHFRPISFSSSVKCGSTGWLCFVRCSMLETTSQDCKDIPPRPYHTVPRPHWFGTYPPPWCWLRSSLAAAANQFWFSSTHHHPSTSLHHWPRALLNIDDRFGITLGAPLKRQISENQYFSVTFPSPCSVRFGSVDVRDSTSQLS